MPQKHPGMAEYPEVLPHWNHTSVETAPLADVRASPGVQLRDTFLSRVKIFLRFAVIFLRSPVIPLIPPLIFQETPIRRYRRTSSANWSWPPLFFNEKPLFPPIFHNKNAGKFFDTDAEKSVPHRKIRFPQKKNKRRCNVFFCFKMEAIVHRNLRLEKSVKKLEKSSFIHQDCCYHHLQTFFIEGILVRQLDSRFLSLWLASWGGPKLKTFAVSVEKQQRKINRRNFAQIVAIRSPPLFFNDMGGNLSAEKYWETALILVNFPRNAGNCR